MIVLDTHVWIYYVSGKREFLTDTLLKAIYSNLESGLGVSQISSWEVAKKHSLGKLELDEDRKLWIKKAESFASIKMLDLNSDIILDSVDLPEWDHKDPMDQLIVATARYYKCALLTKDEKILNYSGVETIS